jgi:phosphoglycerol transferase
LQDSFGSITLQDAMIYLGLPRGEIESVYLENFLLSLLPAIPITILFGIFVHKLVRKGGVAGIPLDALAFAAFSVLAFVSVSLVALIDKNHEVLDYLDNGDETSTYFDEMYRSVPLSRIVFPGKKRNLLLLVLESMENPVADPAVFGESLIPKLDALRADNVHFNRWYPTPGTTFTMAAFTAILNGMPLMARGELDPDNDTVSFDFQPTTPSVLGILEENGYAIAFVRGADSGHNAMNILIEKGTKRGLLADCGYFLEKDPEAEALVEICGLPDSYVFGKARELLTEKAEEQPFAFVVLSLNTHNPGITEQGLPAPFGDYRDSYRQTDTLAAQFVEWALVQPWADDTTIVVMGDHPNSQRILGPVSFPSDRSKRTVFNFFLNLPLGHPRENPERALANWDMAPTILELAGATVPDGRFGLGTSFFSSGQTLLEKVGLPYHNRQIVRRSVLYDSLFTEVMGTYDDLLPQDR